jgi:hypothetical protein
MPYSEDHLGSDFKDFFVQNPELQDKISTYDQTKQTIIGSTFPNVTNQMILADNISTQIDYHNQIKNFPILQETDTGDILKQSCLGLKIISKPSNEERVIVLTPNSINNVTKQNAENFLFDQDDQNIKNYYDLGDGGVSLRQFKITFDKGNKS